MSLPENVELLCCPEDKQCTEKRRHPIYFCPSCELPVCDECMAGMRPEGDKLAMPPASFANDMMVDYAPRELYEDKVAMLEMVGASFCITTMTRFTLEKRVPGRAHV